MQRLSTPPDLGQVVAAATRLAGLVHRTPVATSGTIDAELSAELFFKCENLQKTGSYKARGALNAILQLSDADAKRGVVTQSSGNHGAAVAWAASTRRIRCTVVLEETASPAKVAAVRRYGGHVELCAPGARSHAADELSARTGGVLIDQHENPAVLAGQATATLELLEAAPPLDVVVAPVGGGGLLAASTVAAHATAHPPRIVGGEPAAADDAFRSLQTGTRQPAVPRPDTIADALVGGLGELPFAMLSAANVEIVTVTEAEIVDAARALIHRTKLVVEPSAAVAFAAVRKLDVAGKRVGVILTGGNTDLAWL